MAFFLGKHPNSGHQSLCSTQRRSLWLWNAGGAGRKEATQSLILLVNFTLRQSIKKIFLERWAISFHREIQPELKPETWHWLRFFYLTSYSGTFPTPPARQAGRSWKPQGFALPFPIAAWEKEGEKKQQQQKENAQCSLKLRVLLSCVCIEVPTGQHQSQVDPSPGPHSYATHS